MTKFIIGWLLLAEAVYLHRMRLGWLIEPSGPWEGEMRCYWKWQAESTSLLWTNKATYQDASDNGQSECRTFLGCMEEEW